MSSWHWLRHDWGKWEQYEQRYTQRVFPGELIQQDLQRRRIRQKRSCLTCGTMQDKVVAELHE